MEHSDYLDLTVREAAKGMRAGEGGPFGAVIVKDGKVIGKGHNTVLKSRDPTAHAEVNAIRDACAREGNHRLTGAVLYSNFEPCPMCLSAIYWADIGKVYYSAGREVADQAGFMDNRLYSEICLPEGERQIITERIPLKSMELLLAEWNGLEGKITY